MWVLNIDAPTEWATRWGAGPHDVPEDQVRRIEKALEVEARLTPFGPQRWRLDTCHLLKDSFSLVAEHAEVPFLQMTCYPKGQYVPDAGNFRAHDQITLRSLSEGENRRGDVLCVYKCFGGPDAIENAVLFIATLPQQKEVAMEGYYEVTATPEEPQ
jgi:hypothetical protein